MGRSGNYAWVTSVAGEDQVDKALLLAKSLRRVSTAFKVVAVVTTTASSLSEASRERLIEGYEFDLVVQVPLPPQESGGISQENVEKSLKIQGFSLSAFRKCAYLAPTVVVIKNFDHVFDRGRAGINSGSPKIRSDPLLALNLNSSAYIFHPSKNAYKELKGMVMKCGECETSPSLKLNLNPLQIDLEEEGVVLPVEVGRDGAICNSGLLVDAGGGGSAVNFVDGHPADLWRKGIQLEQLLDGTQPINKPAIATCWSIMEEEETVSDSPGNGGNEPVAIVGMGFRLPGANSQQEFWNLLMEGKDCVRPVPPTRWTPKQTRYPWKSSDESVEAGFLSVPIDEFDARFFGISPKEAASLDPQQRLFLEVSWEALEEAGVDPLSLHGSRTGVFVGSWQYDYKEQLRAAPEYDFLRSYMGASIATQSARLSHFLGLVGPSISTASGCSSSIVAVGLAVQSLRQRETNLCLASGVNLILNPFTHKLMEGGVLSPDYRCSTFDASANGFARAEGVATLVLKRLSDALSSGDRIWGLIRGTGIAQEGLSHSLGTPTVHCEAAAMETALQDAGLDGGDVEYVECHGTGTRVGDPIEIAAIAKAYQCPIRRQPLIIGSLKSVIGHTESASGITGIIKVLLTMKHELIPPQWGLKNLNPDINLEAIPATIPDVPVPWPRNPNRRRKRVAGVSSFGISGTDGHLILEEPPLEVIPKLTTSNIAERPLHLLKLSAKSAESLELMMTQYQQLLESSQNHHRFEDICYSANTGRATFPQRAVILAKDSTKVLEILKSGSFPSAHVGGGNKSYSEICFLFPGQGSQYPGMAAELYATSPLFRFHLDEVTGLLEENYNISIKDVMWASSSEVEDRLSSSSLYSQVAIFCVEYALLKLWECWGVRPDYVMGHSLGEFAAAVAAGILGLEDALRLVVVRAQLVVDSLPPGKMLVVKGDKKVVTGLVAQFQSKEQPHFWADFAALNSPEQTVLAGDSDLIEDFARFCSEHGLKTMVLASSHAFHSRHMDPILEQVGKVASKIPQRSTSDEKKKWPKYISGVEGRIMEPEEIGPDYWIRHTREQVNFLDACEAAKREGVSLFLELGPHPVLCALTMRNLEGSPITALPSLRRNTCDWAVLLDSLGKLFLSDWKGSIDWKGVELGYSRNRVDLPFYPFHRKKVWMEVRPEMPMLHPLLGRKIPTAAASNISIYENVLVLKNLPILEEHVIGSSVIFPGAGYLELGLVAGLTASGMVATRREAQVMVPRDHGPIGLKDLTILSPIAVPECGGVVTQTIASSNEEEGCYTITISRLDDNTDNWVTHATCQFRSGGSSSFFDPTPKQLDLSSVITSSSGSLSWEPRHFYESLAAVGMKFGPGFRSLEAGWKVGTEDETTLLLKMKKVDASEREDYDDDESYLIHPIQIDAMLQAAMICETEANNANKGKLHVPVMIAEFEWFRKSDNPERYIHCGRSHDDGVLRVTLVDGQGFPIASMRGVEWVETSANLIARLVGGEGDREDDDLPQLWQQVYVESSGIPPSPLQMSDAKLELSTELKVELEEFNKALTEQEEGHYKSLCHMTRLFFLKSLYQIGWRPEVGQIFSSEKLGASLGIHERHQKYVNFFLRNLADDVGILERVIGCGPEDLDSHFRFSLEPLPAIKEIEERLNTLRGTMKTCSFPEAEVIMRIGKKLRNVLSGDADPLTLLFPQDYSKVTPGAAQFYQAFARYQTFPVRRFMEKVVLPLVSKQVGIFRILEVGAGTGCFSRIMLDILEDAGIRFEYHYTDVSSVYFAQAEQDFELQPSRNGVIIFKKLDMEVDPLEQGFTPHYFDMLYAGEVLHVAKDMKQTLSHLRLLLKPGGVFQAVETLIPDPRITFVFGLLEGYWQFTDTDFRGRSHTTLTASMWEVALAAAAFKDVVVTPVYMGVHGVILALADDKGISMGNHAKHAWIIFGGDDKLTRELEEKLVRLNRKVNVFRKPITEMEFGGDEQVFKESLRGLVAATVEDGSRWKLEGVLYLWGLVEEEDYSSEFRDQLQISLPFLSLCQVVSGLEVMEEFPRIVVVTQGLLAPHEDDSNSRVGNPSGGTLSGIIRSIQNEVPNLKLSQLDLSPASPPTSQLDLIVSSLWRDGGIHIHHPMSAFRGDTILTPKLVRWKPPKLEYSLMPSLFSESNSYLVTGGLGRIGFEVVRWILRSGGKHVVIVDRGRPPKPEIGAMIRSWNMAGKHVEAFAVDVGNYEECLNLFGVIQENPAFPPLRGVMHAAGVRSDGTLQNQSWLKFRETYNTKVVGSWNLHQLTRHLPLEHFVLFSSISATFGYPGQSNLSGASSFLDALANYRNSIGLPVTCVNWGNWGGEGAGGGGVGVGDIPGISPIRPSQGIQALELFLGTSIRSAVVVANIDSFQMLATSLPSASRLIDSKLLLGGTPPLPPPNKWNTDEFWVELDRAVGWDQRLAVFKKLVKTTLHKILRLEAVEGIEDGADLSSLGVDSLMMLELKSGLQSVFGSRLKLASTADLKDGSGRSSSSNAAVVATRLLTLYEERSGVVSSERRRRRSEPEKISSFAKLKQEQQQFTTNRENISPIPPESVAREAKRRIGQVETILLTTTSVTTANNLGPDNMFCFD